MGCASSIPNSRKSSTDDSDGVEQKPRPQPQLVGNYTKDSVHDEFVKMAAADGFFGRDQLVDKILTEHITATSTITYPLILFGSPGSGKTAILAALVRRCMEMKVLDQLPKIHSWRIFYHFTGSVPGSTDLLTMLQRLLVELQSVKTSENELPSKLEDAIGLVCCALSKPSTDDGYIIFIDAVNLFDEVNKKEAAPISWLPLRPAPNVRLIITSTAETSQFRQMCENYTDDPPDVTRIRLPRNLSSETYERLSKVHRITAPEVHIVDNSSSNQEELKQYGRWAFLEVPLLSKKSDQRQIVNFHLTYSSKPKKLREREIELLTTKADSDNPLWLRLAVEEICQSPPRNAEQLAEIVMRLPRKLEDLETTALERIERSNSNSGLLIIASLCFIASSVNGLDIEEVQELLAISPIKLPTELVGYLTKEGGLKQEAEVIAMSQTSSNEDEIKSVLDSDVLRFFLRTFEGLNQKRKRFVFYHPSFARTVRKRYLLSTSKRRYVDTVCLLQRTVSTFFHSRLANYFKTRCQDLQRRCECFPTHAYLSNDKAGLKSFLSNWDHFDTMYNKEFSWPLSKAWTYVYDLKIAASKVATLVNRRQSQPAEPVRKEVSKAEMFKTMQDTYLAKLDETYPPSLDATFSEKAKDDPELPDKFVDRLQRVANVLSQNGCFDGAESIADRLTNVITDPDKTNNAFHYASALYLKAETFYLYIKSLDLVRSEHAPKMELATRCYKGSIEILRQFAQSDDLRIGKASNHLAYLYSSVCFVGGSDNLPVDKAKIAAFSYVGQALDFYHRPSMKDHHSADLAACYVTRGICEGIACDLQLDYYTKAYDLIVQEYGLYHPLLEQIYLDTGIHYEERGNCDKAYDNFYKWHELAMMLYGPTHPISKRATRTLREQKFVVIAVRRGCPVPISPDELLQDDVESEDGSDEDS